MALVSMRQLLDHAAENGYGLPAFNVNNLEQSYILSRRSNPLFVMSISFCRRSSGFSVLSIYPFSYNRSIIRLTSELLPSMRSLMYPIEAGLPERLPRNTLKILY